MSRDRGCAAPMRIVLFVADAGAVVSAGSAIGNPPGTHPASKSESEGQTVARRIILELIS